jgi:eukaryotic-like serine/threonine-protein kinase
MDTDSELERLGIQPGQIIAGRYRVEHLLGQGGMGVVVAATHTALDDTVAIKFLMPSISSSPATVARFLREAQAAGKIKSRHVARVIDFGALDSGVQFMVMEHLEGMDLGRVLKERGAVDVALASRYALETCEGLAAAHALGIVHRDIKPGNLFLARGPGGAEEIKLLDFGISKVEPTSPESLTRTHTAMGSPCYMAPEQMRSAREVDTRADQWSLGVVLFELVTGRVPFQAESLPELCSLVLEGTAPPVRSIKPELPERLERLLARCLARRREDRYADVGELSRELAPLTLPEGPLIAARVDRVLHGSESRPPELSEPPSVEEPAAPGVSSPSHGAVTNTTFGRTRGSLGPQPRSRRAIFGVVGAAVATGAVVWLVVGRGTEVRTEAVGAASRPVATEARAARPSSEPASSGSVAIAPAALSVSPVPSAPQVRRGPIRIEPRRADPRTQPNPAPAAGPSPYDERK